jgi:hypothetical protein
LFINQEIIDVYRVGVGDEAFLVGRLMSHDGQQKNAPVVQFGIVSLMADPNEPIRCKEVDQEGFLVECRSLSGFSGSPVFVQTTQTYREQDAERVCEYGQRREPNPEPEPSGMVIKPLMIDGTWGPWLLGINWGHMPFYGYVEEHGNKRLDLRVELNTGFACVLPAWKIMELLNVEELVKERRKQDQRIAKRKELERREGAAVNDVAEREDVFTQQDFEDALEKVTRKVKPTDR